MTVKYLSVVIMLSFSSEPERQDVFIFLWCLLNGISTACISQWGKHAPSSICDRKKKLSSSVQEGKARTQNRQCTDYALDPSLDVVKGYCEMIDLYCRPTLSCPGPDVLPHYLSLLTHLPHQLCLICSMMKGFFYIQSLDLYVQILWCRELLNSNMMSHN